SPQASPGRSHPRDPPRLTRIRRHGDRGDAGPARRRPRVDPLARPDPRPRDRSDARRRLHPPPRPAGNPRRPRLLVPVETRASIAWFLSDSYRPEGTTTCGGRRERIIAWFFSDVFRPQGTTRCVGAGGGAGAAALGGDRGLRL